MPTETRGYIVDTNVLSNRRDADIEANVSEWLRRYASLVRVSVVTIAEMERGLILLAKRAEESIDHSVKIRLSSARQVKHQWYDEMIDRFGDRIEPIDLPIARKWAAVSVRFPSLRDGDKVIAATALAKRYGIATRNLGDFRQTGVPLVNPFDPGTWDETPDGDPIATLLRK